AVQPVDEQHLHRPAAVPVALLVVRTHATDAGPKALHVEGGQARIVLGDDAELPFGARRATGEADLAVRPRLRRHPLDLVVAIRTRWAEDVVVALGVEVPALVDLDVGVTSLHGLQLA